MSQSASQSVSQPASQSVSQLVVAWPSNLVSDPPQPECCPALMQKVNSGGVDRALGDRPSQEHVTRAAVAMLTP